MTRIHLQGIACAAVLLGALSLASPTHAQVGLGTWVRQAGRKLPGEITMTVGGVLQRWTTADIPAGRLWSGLGRRVAIRRPRGAGITQWEAERRDHGDQAPGRPSYVYDCEDERQRVRHVKGHSLSADGKTITVENDFTASIGGNSVGKHTERWLRK